MCVLARGYGEGMQDLMNACISRPHDPYIRITSKYWTPYIELILRAVGTYAAGL